MDGSSSQNVDLGNRKGGLALDLSPGIETAYVPANASMPLSAPMADIMAAWLSEFFSALGSLLKLCHGAAVPPVGACLPLCLF